MIAFRGGINTKEYQQRVFEGEPTVSEQLYAYLATLGTWTLDVRFKEPSGDLMNYGTDGNSAVVTNATYSQEGQLGKREAYLYDGLNTSAVFNNSDVIETKNLTTQRWCFLINPTNLGESSNAAFYWWVGAASNITFASSNRIFASIDAATDASARTNTNQVDFLGNWTLVFVDYDDTNLLGLGRHIRIMRATSASATTLLTLATNIAAVGAVIVPSGTLSLGNDNAFNRTFDGLIDFMVAGPGLWSPAGTPADLTIPNAIRSIVFGV